MADTRTAIGQGTFAEFRAAFDEDQARGDIAPF